MVQVNVLGAMYTVKAALPHMLSGRGGHIVVLSSAAGLRSFPWGAVYGGTKAFDRGFAEALRHELAGSGVSVTTVFPGEYATRSSPTSGTGCRTGAATTRSAPSPELVDAIVAGVEADTRAVYAPRGRAAPGPQRPARHGSRTGSSPGARGRTRGAPHLTSSGRFPAR